ncbi:MAG: helix-turn-helix transcriptional regulator [Haliscomenobacter sp.]|uniref:helix-turn-helix transcriptional regulator n=1 Tax=Haliscomenobacter sp. TaxID=2717303 RepID=UPI0029B507AB|nr:helix-turn-helix transcriptional regulator [Haliscomenobacter sp.]MDX2068207.1 helix-turn-helix transcriptional regulator [Haliscomenobacter sp.]
MQLEESLRKNLAKNLVRLREERELTQEGLVKVLLEKYGLNLSRTSLAAYEADRSYPKVDALYVLARYFETSIDELLQQGGAVKKETVYSGADVDQLMQEFGEVLEFMHFYRSLFYSAVKTADKIADEKIRYAVKEHLMDVFLLEESKREAFQAKIGEVLDAEELRVFTMVQKGARLNELALLLQRSDQAVMELFIAAKNKVLKTIK